jgi:hypothetical protein
MGADESKPAEPVPKHVPMPAQTQNKMITNASMLEAGEKRAAREAAAAEKADMIAKKLEVKTRELQSCIKKYQYVADRLKIMEQQRR